VTEKERKTEREERVCASVTLCHDAAKCVQCVCVCVQDGKRVCERVRVHHNLDRFVKLVYVPRLIHV